MSDPFNFNSLKKTTPRYLGLEALSDVIEEMNKVEEVPFVGDVTMEDQEPDDEIMEDAIMSDEKEKVNEKDEKDEIEEILIEKPQTPILHDDEDEKNKHFGLSQVFSPTNSGAQLALREEPQNVYPPNINYNYHIKLPIPVPWSHNLPYVLSTYTQLLFNFAVFLCVGWLLRIVHKDVKSKMQERSAETVYHAAWCREQFYSNGCHDPEKRPVLVDSKFCLEMEKCMDKDPDSVRWVSMYASLVAEVVNELIEPLTPKTMASLAVLIVSALVCAFTVNYLFGFVRARTLFSHPAKPKKKQSKSRRRRSTYTEESSDESESSSNGNERANLIAS